MDGAADARSRARPLTPVPNGGFERTYTRFSQAIEEVVDARIWSCIHFRTADEAGARIGKDVARYRHAHYFKPVG